MVESRKMRSIRMRTCLVFKKEISAEFFCYMKSHQIHFLISLQKGTLGLNSGIAKTECRFQIPFTHCTKYCPDIHTSEHVLLKLFSLRSTTFES